MKTVSLNIACIIALIILHTYAILARGEEEQKTKPAEERLYENLFEGYNRQVKPGREEINVTLRVDPNFLDELDEEKAMLSLHSTLTFWWLDNRLQWDPAEYDQVTALRVHSSKLWIPDVRVYNGPSTDVDTKGATNAIVYSDGSVLWVPPTLLRFFCPDPFPESNNVKLESRNADRICQATLGSWTFDGWMLNLKPRKMNFEHFSNGHPKWEVLTSECKLERIVKYYSCCQEPYVTINATFPLRRKTVGPVWQSAVVFPCAVAAFLGLWTSFSGSLCKNVRTVAVLLSFLSAILVFVSSNVKLAPQSSNAGSLLIWTTVLLLSNLVINTLVSSICLRPAVLHSKFVTKLLSSAVKSIPAIGFDKSTTDETKESSEDLECYMMRSAVTSIVAILHAIAFITIFGIFT